MTEYIASDTDLAVALGINTNATTNETALLGLIHGPAEQAVKDYIGYDPIQATRIEFYTPRDQMGPAWDVWYAEGEWIDRVTPAKVHWLWPDRADKICTRHLPIRSITEIREDSGAKAGQESGSFPASTVLTSGTDFWVDFDESGLCRSGFIYRESGWATWGRSIKVTGVYGYTANEFNTIASPIKLAVIQTAIVMFRQIVLNQKIGGSGAAGGGFVAGQVLEEELDQYRVKFSDGTGSGKAGAGFSFDPGIPPEAAMSMLDPFVNFCRKMAN